MSKRKSTKAFKKIRKALASLLVLAVFILPMYATGRWLKVVIFGNESRKVITPKEIADTGSFDNLAPFKEPLITITFDDGWESIYSTAYETMAKYGILTTQYILGDEFKNVAYMSEAQVRSLQKAGHEIASHTMSHPNLTKIDDEDLAFEIQRSRAELEKRFGLIRDFATPLGAYDDRVVGRIKDSYRSHRNTDADPQEVDELDVNTESRFNRYNIIAYAVRRTTKIDDIKRLIAYTMEHNGWLVLTYHQIDDSDAHFGIDEENFKEHIRLVSSSGARLPTMGRVLDAMNIKQEQAQ